MAEDSKVTNIRTAQDKLRELSSMVQRLQLGNMAGLQYAGDRNLYTVFGYQINPTAEQFLAKYVRQDITTRIIDAPPLATWSNPPEIENEVLKKQWDELMSSARVALETTNHRKTT